MIEQNLQPKDATGKAQEITLLGLLSICRMCTLMSAYQFGQAYTAC